VRPHRIVLVFQLGSGIRAKRDRVDGCIIGRRPHARPISGHALLAFGKPHVTSHLRWADPYG